MAGRCTVLVSPRAQAELREMIDKYPLPDDTPTRVARRLEDLERFPNIGLDLPPGKYGGYQMLFGPFAWMASIYRVEGNVVRVASIEDSRRSGSAAGS